MDTLCNYEVRFTDMYLDVKTGQMEKQLEYVSLDAYQITAFM